MKDEAPAETEVYLSRSLLWFGAILTPIGIYAIIGTLLQSFGLYIPPFNPTDFPADWYRRAFLLIILFFVLKDFPSILSTLASKKVYMLVSDHGVSFPDQWSLEWDEIEQVKNNSFGWLTFVPKDPRLEPVTIFVGHAAFWRWRAAKARIKQQAPARISEVL
ncbi:MAG: hypothetical protein AAF292_11365 [Pseudomonadota bacterium]